MTKDSNTIAVLYTTVNDIATGQDMVQHLLKLKLIVCANIFTSIQSSYLWKGKICNDTEVIILLKTKPQLVQTLVDIINNIHPYEIPCILEIDILKVHNHKYLKWLSEEI